MLVYLNTSAKIGVVIGLHGAVMCMFGQLFVVFGQLCFAYQYAELQFIQQLMVSIQ
jgi:hypothetical protein